MRQDHLTMAVTCQIMADLHDSLNRLCATDGEGLIPYRGICPQLANVMHDLGYGRISYPYRKQRSHLLSDLMRGWVRRNPTLGHSPRKAEYLLMYPILPAGYATTEVIHLSYPLPTQEDLALHLFTRVHSWGEFSQGDSSRFAAPPQKPAMYEEYISARLNLLAYLRDTTGRVHARLAAQLADKAVAHG